MHDVLVFAALAWEVRAATQALSGVEPAGRPGTWRGYLGDGVSCLVVRTGLGLDRARAAAEAAPPARLFLSAGCAGALSEDLHAGDVVMADGVVRLDRDLRQAERLPAASAGLMPWAVGRGFAARAGLVVSSPIVLDGALRSTVAAATGGHVVEMESAAVAAVARRRGVPFLGVRVVLDEADQVLPNAPGMLDEATGEMRVLRTVGALAAHPGWWAGLARLARQRQICERRLRTLLGGLLGGGLDALGQSPSVATG
jgi:nucleoside phosphorylase